MKGFRRALALATAERYFCLAANFVSLAVVSRLLTPSEIGVSVIGMAIAAFAQAVRELATTNFIIQRKDLTEVEVQVTFTNLLLLTLAITAVMAISAGELARLYSEPRLEAFLLISALAILSEVVSAPITALLRREMAIGKLAIIHTTGMTVNVGLTIVLAVLGYSYMSMAWGWLASTLWISILSLLVWPAWSIFIPRLTNWREVAAFGCSDGANTVLYAICDSIPYLILGRVLSFDAAAIYNRGVMLCRLPDKVFLGGLSSVILSAFSRELRNGKALHTVYLRSIQLLTGVVWPALLLLAILADWVVQVLLGSQWLAATPVVRIIAIASLFSFSAHLNHPILLASGATRDILRRSLIIWPVSAVIIAVASLGGLETASLAWVLTMPFQAYVSLRFVQRHIDIGWKETAAALLPSAKVAMFASAGPLAVAVINGWSFDVASVLPPIAILLCAIGWVIGLYLTGHPLLDELKRILSLGRFSFPRAAYLRVPAVESAINKR